MLITLKGRFMKKLQMLRKHLVSKSTLRSSNQSNSAKAHLSLYLKSKGTPPKEICKDDLYFNFDFNLNHYSGNEYVYACIQKQALNQLYYQPSLLSQVGWEIRFLNREQTDV